MYRPVQPTQANGAGVSPVRMALYSQRNRETLQNTLAQEFQSKVGPLNERQRSRLEKALDHYVDEVYSIQGDKPISVLNREIIAITRQDFSTYLQRQEVVRQAPTTAIQTVANDTLFQDTSTRFSQLQNERQEVKALPPSVPDFRIPLEEDGPTSVDLFEKAKKQREAEALRLAAASQMKDAMDRIDPGIQRRMNADDTFRAAGAAASRATDLALIERQRAPRTMDMPLVVPPDRRELMLPANVIIEPTGSPRDLGQGNSNPTITYPPFGSREKTNLSQDVIIREERVISYKEIEYNLFMYSADRNWLMNTKENRYNFTVVFDPGNMQGNLQGPTQQIDKKFKNIVRIELVKAIFPVEGIYTFTRATPLDASDSSYQYNILSLPYVSVVIDELDNNNFGTDNMIDKSFGVIQYDANWFSDLTTTKDSRGFTAFIPKFLKCQKVYEPTPLSTLQKLSVSFVQPNGELVSPTHDALDISEIWGAGYSSTNGSIFNLTQGSDPKYFFIYTKEFFSRFQFSVGDILRVGNYNYEPGIMTTSERLRYFCEWINQYTGYMIVGIGYNKTPTQFVDGPNAVGYANCIIIGARYQNPSTGSTSLYPFGPNINNAFIANYGRVESPRRCINLSRQVQLVLRVITRELDPAGQLRPDDI